MPPIRCRNSEERVEGSSCADAMRAMVQLSWSCIRSGVLKATFPAINS